MNPFKGLGVVLIAGVVVLVATQVSNISELILVASIAIVFLSLITLVASARRRSLDRRIAGGRARTRTRTTT